MLAKGISKYMSTFALKKDKTFVSYVLKRGKYVAFQKTCYHGGKTAQIDKKKPYIILDYNFTQRRNRNVT